MKKINIETAAKMLNVPGEVEPYKNLKKILKADNSYDILISLSEPAHKPSVRRWAIEGLATFENPKVSKCLKQSLKDEFMTVRLHAVRAIWSRNKTPELKALIPLLDDESGGIRLNVLEVLGRRRYKGIDGKIKKMMKDEKNYIRKKAKDILAERLG